MEKIVLITEDGEEVEFIILDQVALGGKNYLLVADSEEDDATALILRDDAPQDAEESLYSIVEDENELDGVLTLLKDTLEELGFDLEEEDE